MLIHPDEAGHPNEVKWTKIFTWRVNGDGIHPFGNTRVEDCFLRTPDDSLYVGGLGIRRILLWDDADGSAFVLSALPRPGEPQLLRELRFENPTLAGKAVTGLGFFAADEFVEDLRFAPAAAGQGLQCGQ